MQAHDRYITYKRGEPPAVSIRAQLSVKKIDSQRKRNTIHALVHADATGERPTAADQTVPGFAGFQALISAPVEQSKAYYLRPTLNHPKNLFSAMSC